MVRVRHDPDGRRHGVCADVAVRQATIEEWAGRQARQTQTRRLGKASCFVLLCQQQHRADATRRGIIS